MLIVAVLNWSLSSWKSFVNHLSFGAAPPDAGVTTQRAVEVWIYGLTWRRNNLEFTWRDTWGIAWYYKDQLHETTLETIHTEGHSVHLGPREDWDQSGKKHDLFHLRSILFSGRIWKKQTWLSISTFPHFQAVEIQRLADAWIKIPIQGTSLVQLFLEVRTKSLSAESFIFCISGYQVSWGRNLRRQTTSILEQKVFLVFLK